MNKLQTLVKELFPSVDIDSNAVLRVGSVPEWDSLGHFNLLMSVEEEFDIKFSMEEMSELKTLPEIESVIESKGKAL